MAELKKNAVNQILFTMVDATDFATVEEALAASNFGVKRFGVNRGSAACSISTVSRVPSVVGSGIYRLSLEAATCNFDYLALRITCSGAAKQILAYEMKTLADDDISNYLSNFSNYLSNASNYLSNISAYLSAAGDTSDVASAVWAHAKGTSVLSYGAVAASAASDAYSVALLNQSAISDVKSAITLLASELSDVHSQATLIVSQTSDIYSLLGNASLYSDIASAVWAHAVGNSVAGRVSKIVSIASDAHSAAAKSYSQVILAASVISDIQSALDSQALLNASWFSDIDSAITSHLSKINQINSRVLLAESFASDAHSAAAQANSRALVIESTLSDIDSAITSRFSDLHSHMSTTGVGLNASMLSDLRSAMNAASVFLQASDISDLLSAIAAGPAATITDSDISNIASAVWGFKYDTNSVASSFGSLFEVMASGISDTQSALDSQYLIMLSRISDVYSLVSDVQSAVAIAATASDVASKVWAEHYQSYDTASTFGSRFQQWGVSGMNLTASDMSDLRSGIAAGPTATVTDSDISNIASAVWAFHYTGNSLVSSFGSAFEVMVSQLSDAHSAAILAASHASNVHSAVASMQSDITSIESQIVLLASVASDAHSAAAQANSRALVIQSMASDAHSAAILAASHASDAHSLVLLNQSAISDIKSAITLLASELSDVHSQATLIVSDTSNIYSLLGSASLYSDIASAVWGQHIAAHSLASSFGSAYSDIYSRVGVMISRVTAAVATQSKLGVVESKASDAHSAAAKSYSQVILAASELSDVHSAVTLLASELSDVHSQATLIVSQTSDIYSRLNDASLYSDIASAVWAQKWDIHSTASTFGSAFAKRFESGFEARASDLSDLRSAMNAASVWLQASDFSDILSAIAAGPAATVTASDVSLIAAGVWDLGYSDHLTASTFGSRLKAAAGSDQLSKAQSDIRSIVSGITASVDNLSVASAVWAHSQAVVLRSTVSDIDSALTSQYTKVYSAVQAGGLTASAMSDIASRVWAEGPAASLISRVSDIQSAIDSQYLVRTSDISDIKSMITVAQSMASDAHSAAILAASHASDAHSAAALAASHSSNVHSLLTLVASNVSDIESALDSQYAAGYFLDASGLSDVGSVVDARLNTAFTDATSLTANSLKDRIRTMQWILRNKMATTDATGDTILFKDDNTTEAYSVAAALADDGTTTTRKRLE